MQAFFERDKQAAIHTQSHPDSIVDFHQCIAQMGLCVRHGVERVEYVDRILFRRIPPA